MQTSHTTVVTGMTSDGTAAMRLGLSHSLCRFKLKFSPDKVDTMIIQAIALLDELDKELNTYAMRVREWYGWHFPESRECECSCDVHSCSLWFRFSVVLGFRDCMSTCVLFSSSRPFVWRTHALRIAFYLLTHALTHD
jgi:hypothetical protein